MAWQRGGQHGDELLVVHGPEQAGVQVLAGDGHLAVLAGRRVVDRADVGLLVELRPRPWPSARRWSPYFSSQAASAAQAFVQLVERPQRRSRPGPPPRTARRATTIESSSTACRPSGWERMVSMASAEP